MQEHHRWSDRPYAATARTKRSVAMEWAWTRSSAQSGALALATAARVAVVVAVVVVSRPHEKLEEGVRLTTPKWP